MKSAFTRVMATIRAGLEGAASGSVDDAQAAPLLPANLATRRTELVAQFGNELERVDGHYLGVLSPAQACRKIVELTGQMESHSVAVGDGVALDLAPVVNALGRAGIESIRCGKTNDDERLALRERLANCDLAIVEAHYAIAATGTLVLVATPERPASLTLLPPTNILLVEADRVLPDMAAVISALGPNVIRQHRVAFITGPSRTADIEKMIVLGVHGPKHLYAAVVWPG